MRLVSREPIQRVEPPQASDWGLGAGELSRFNSRMLFMTEQAFYFRWL
jgi:hypothetical protein